MHSPLPRAVGFTMVRLQLPAAVAGALQVTGVGVGLGTGVGVGDGEGDGDGEADGDGLGDGLGDGEALGLGLALGDGLGDGDGPGTTLTWTVAVACDDPARATRLKLVVHAGVIWRVPLGVTVPMPLSISMLSAPSTSHVSVAAAPAFMSAGVATNFWMASVGGWVNSLTIPQRSKAIPRSTRTIGWTTRRTSRVSGIENPFKVRGYTRYVK